MQKSVIINTKGDWKLFYKVWEGAKYRKVIRKLDNSVDIVKADNQYRIYSKNPIPQLALYYKSTNKSEPRPYYYYANENEIKKIFNELDKSLLNKLDDSYYIQTDNKFRVF